jgi:membrane protein
MIWLNLVATCREKSGGGILAAAREPVRRSILINSSGSEASWMLSHAWMIAKETVSAFIEDNALSRGAAMAFYAVTSLGPVLLIVVAIAGLVFGEDAARDAIVSQFGSLMGQQSAELFQTVIKGAASKSSGIIASIIGAVTLLLTASGVFSEMQAALNTFWKATPQGTTVSRLIRARLVGLGLVAAMGFLLMVSLVVSAGLAAFSGYISARLPFGNLILQAINLIVSLALISAMFAAIYKILPDKQLEWRDVIVGAVVTAVLFNLGKYLVGFYIGHSGASSSYGAAGALIVVLLWIYYSSQIFLLGAEFTKVYSAHLRGERPGPVPAPGSTSSAIPGGGNRLVRSRLLLTLLAVAGTLIRTRRDRRRS